jgi:hypothetical protein
VLPIACRTVGFGEGGSILRACAVVLTLLMPETHATAYDSKIEGNVIFTRFDAALNWVRKISLWPMPMGLACCAIDGDDGIAFRIARFGAKVMRFLAAAMRRDDRGRDCYLQNGAGGETNL